jgi:hypothetical protein
MLARGVVRGWTSRKHELWKSVHRQLEARGYLKRPSDKIAGELNLSRNQLRIMTGLLTGHCCLQGFLFKLGLADSP